MAAQWPPVKNDAAGYVFYVSLVSQANTKIFQVNPTLAAGDVKIAIDDGAPANLTTLPAVDADFTKRVKVVLSQAETNGDNISLVWADAAGAEWCDLTINLQTIPARQTGDVYALAAGATGFAAIAGYIDTEVAAIITLLDTEIAAIKAKTDQLTFTNANTLDASIQAVTDFTAAVANKLADHIIRRTLANVRASSNGDALTGRSLLGAASKLTNKISTVETAGKVSIYEENDTTVFFRQTLTTDPTAEPITVADTD